jgi:hippurate hydrolase
MDNLRFLQQSQEPELFLEIQAHRHHLHKFPELSLVEYNTRDYIATKLKEYGFEEVYSGIGGTGVVAVLHGTLDESILLRADMDALPL